MFDCCMINNELDLLEIRINTVNTVVEKFVVVESDITHSSKPRPLIFFNEDGSPNNRGRERFAPFLDQMIFLLYRGKPEYGAWGNEGEQRNTILKALDVAKPTDGLLFVSDVDEIAKPEKLLEARHVFEQTGLPCSVLMHYCMYYMNCCSQTAYWGPYLYSPEALKKTIWPNDSPTRNRWHVWSSWKNDWPHVEDGGWHFSTMGSVENIQHKLNSYAHVEFAKEEVASKENIQQAIENGKPYFEKVFTFDDYKDLKFSKRDINFLPPYVLACMDKFGKYIKQ